MRTTTSPGFDIWDAFESLHGAFGPRSAGRSAHASPHGDVRAAVLTALAQGPQNGRQVMESVAARTGGEWSPGASEIYPMLQQLADEGLSSARHDGERTVYELTDAGRAAAAEAAASSESPYGSHPRWRDSSALVPRAGAKLAQAAAQVLQNGTREQQERAAAMLDETRRKLYAILAED
jgi:DNA-binding PadR family transcriptional regulator